MLVSSINRALPNFRFGMELGCLYAGMVVFPNAVTIWPANQEDRIEPRFLLFGRSNRAGTMGKSHLIDDQMVDLIDDLIGLFPKHSSIWY